LISHANAATALKRWRRERDLAHTFERLPPSLLGQTEESANVSDQWPDRARDNVLYRSADTDAKTVRMKLSVAGSMGALLAISVVAPLLMH
jgi:hypothetical protein